MSMSKLFIVNVMFGTTPVFSSSTVAYSRAGSVSVFGVGISIGILKYLGIRYRYRLPTQDSLQ